MGKKMGDTFMLGGMKEWRRHDIGKREKNYQDMPFCKLEELGSHV